MELALHSSTSCKCSSYLNKQNPKNQTNTARAARVKVERGVITLNVGILLCKQESKPLIIVLELDWPCVQQLYKMHRNTHTHP